MQKEYGAVKNNLCQIFGISQKVNKILGEKYQLPLDKKLEAHSFADFFPESDQIEREQLQESILLEGQIEPILLFEGKIVDGRTRYKILKENLKSKEIMACDWLGDEDGLHDYLINKSQQRQLTKSQRAFVALAFLKKEEELAKTRQGKRTGIKKGADGKVSVPKVMRAKDTLAARFGTNREYIDKAQYIRANANELVPFIRCKDVSLGVADFIAKKINNEIADKIGKRLKAVEEYKKNKEKAPEERKSIEKIVEEILGKTLNNIPPGNMLKLIFTESPVWEEFEKFINQKGYAGVSLSTKTETTKCIDRFFKKENISVVKYYISPKNGVSTPK